MGILSFSGCQQKTKKGSSAVGQACVFAATSKVLVKKQETKLPKEFVVFHRSTFSSRLSDWDVLLQPTTGHLVSTRQFLPSQGPSSVGDCRKITLCITQDDGSLIKNPPFPYPDVRERTVSSRPLSFAFASSMDT
jgi:hypothetical protein